MLYPEEDEKKKKNKFYFKKTYDDDLKDLVKLLNKKNFSTKHKNTNSSSSTQKTFGGYSVSQEERTQRCTVKMRYSNKIDSHQKFLNHYMVQENKDDVKIKPTIFGNDSLENYQKRMSSNHFKFIISPDNPNVPLKDFAFSYMDAISKMLNKKFDWQAVVHTNTEHPHLHILINGKTLDGLKLNRPFPKNFMKKQSRIIAQELITKIIGERTTEEIFIGKEKSIQSLRVTNYDKEIEQYLLENNTNRIEKEKLTERQQKRIKFLEENKLTIYRNKCYYFTNTWKTDLENAGRYNTYLQAKESLKFNITKNFSLFNKKNEKISGVLKKVYCMNDEDIWTNALVIENKELQKAWYVPLHNSTEKFMSKVGLNISYEQKLDKNNKYKSFIYIDEKEEIKKEKIIKKENNKIQKR